MAITRAGEAERVVPADQIELTGGWAVASPYTVTGGGVELAVEHLPDGLAVTAPVGWRVHVPTHSGVRYVHIPEGWSSIEPLATQCVVLENGERFCNLTCREPEYLPGHLEIGSERSRVHLRWQFGGAQVPGFHCLTFNSWAELIAEHRQWMTEVGGLRPLAELAPAWVVDCPLMVYIDIERVVGDGGLYHSFADVEALAHRLAEIQAPRDTLVYLTTWNDGGQRRYPTYEPSAAAGGLDGLRRAADALHGHGYRLMLHSNVWGCSPTHPEYTRLVSHMVHNRAGHPLSWREFHQGYVAEHIYIRPDSGAFRELFWGSLQPLVAELGVDALYLDQAGLLVDDPLVNILDATRRLIDTIRADAPELVLGGQVLTTRLCDQITMWQLWGTPWSGHGWGQPFRRRSRLIADLFHGLTRFMAHAYLPPAVPGRYLWTHEGFSDDLGTVGCFLAAQEDNSYHDAVRCVRLNFRDHGVDPLAHEVIEQARRRAAT
jgi:hypothetical protein